MYGQYPPHPYAPLAQPNHTREGVKFISWSMLLYIVSALVGFALGLYIINTVLQFLTSTATMDSSVLSTIMTLAVVALALAIPGLLAFIFLLYGLYRMYQGKDAYGPVHVQNIQRGILLLLIGFILPSMGSMLTSSGSVSAPADVYSSIKTSIIISGALSLVSNFLWAFGMYNAVKLFASEEKSKFTAGMLLLAMGPVVGICVMEAILPASASGGATADQLRSLLSGLTVLLSVGGIVSCVGYGAFFMAFRGILKRLETEPQMLYPRPPMMPQYPAPVQYQYPAGYPQQPPFNPYYPPPR
jgi:hypothetical protein